MITSLCNVRVKNIRPKYNNLKEWLEDSNNVYIGRGGIVIIDGERIPKKSSIWANPFKAKDFPNEDILNMYYEYITKKIEDENLIDELLKLKGKNLGCWCTNTDSTKHNNTEYICHGQILLSLIDLYSK